MLIGLAMTIRVFGPFEFDKVKVNDKDYVRQRWDEIDTEIARLSEACGVYIFTIRNAKNHVPVYIGQASSASSFRKRVFSDDKFRTTIKYFNENKGVMTVLLLARPKPVQEGFAVITDEELDFLETFCILCALRKNENITNISKTRMAERMRIPGLTGTFRQGHPGTAVQTLLNSFEME
ncbi:MAG: hypothetical protein JNK46_20930 [Methylobacteriaceae bacterium]|nr:hypothetical protein [Methylobacteriaceae bacterium]